MYYIADYSTVLRVKSLACCRLLSQYRFFPCHTNVLLLRISLFQTKVVSVHVLVSSMTYVLKGLFVLFSKKVLCYLKMRSFHGENSKTSLGNTGIYSLRAQLYKLLAVTRDIARVKLKKYSICYSVIT